MGPTQAPHAQPDVAQTLRSHDYVSPGMAVVIPDQAFPDMIVGDTSITDWPFLRRWVEHNWYADQQEPQTGFINRDEATILYNNASLFNGKRSLEIGCWRGWSAVHIALGTGMLDVVDPLLGDGAVAAKVCASFEKAGVLDRIALHAGPSPDAVDALASGDGQRWSFAFIDGNHDGDAPARDAEAVMRHAADTAMVLFHDLVSPHVAAGLNAMRDAGWRTMIYQTMQIMGVAWRGEVEPVHHRPDPGIFWTLPRHLAGYEISGWKPPGSKKTEWWDGMTMQDRRDVASTRAQAAEDSLLESRAEFASMTGRLQEAHTETIGLKAQLSAVSDRIEKEIAEADLLEVERDAALARANAAENSVAQLIEHSSKLTSQLLETAAMQAEHKLLVPRLEQAEQELSALAHVRSERDALQDELRELAGRKEAAEQKVDLMVATRAAQEARVQTLHSACAEMVDLNAAHTNKNVALMDMARWLARKRILIGLMRRSSGERVAVVRRQATVVGLDDMISEPTVAWIARPRTLLGLLRRSTASAQAFISCEFIQGAQSERTNALERLASFINDTNTVGAINYFRRR